MECAPAFTSISISTPTQQLCAGIYIASVDVTDDCFITSEARKPGNVRISIQPPAEVEAVQGMKLGPLGHE